MDLHAIKQAVGDLDEGLVYEMLDAFVLTRPSETETQDVVEACQQGMEIVGDLFEKGDYFVGDLIFAGELLTGVVDRVKHLLGESQNKSRGKIVLGTVAGDIHDIGKNIFRSMAETAGFAVVDIGIDQSPEVFVRNVKENSAHVVGLSGVLTLSIDSMKKTVDALSAAGLRDNVKVIIGGNAVNAGSSEYVGADAWSKNAADAVKTCSGWVRQ